MTPATEFNPMQTMTERQILDIPKADLPLIVLSDNMRSIVSWGIKFHEHGNYNHFMWMHKPGTVCTQGITLHEEPIENFFFKYRLKFWTGAHWTPGGRNLLKHKLAMDLSKPWYKRLYDPLQIFGLFFGMRWLQIPGRSRICSDHIDNIRLVDPLWEIKRHLSPPEVNRQLSWNDNYQVYGRYIPD